MTPRPLTGSSLIGRRESRQGAGSFTSVDPRTGRAGDVQFAEATPAEVIDATRLAARAFDAWRSTAARGRARFLRQISTELEARREAIVGVADSETGLGTIRLNGELDRTRGQLNAFADVLENGSYVEAIISYADPRAVPPTPDLRRMLVPIGPIAVFTPSNFPLAFGAAGGDTASALAAGCPVIVKGHPSHPGTTELCARAMLAAADSTGMPDGVFSLIQAREIATAQALVTAPDVHAVGFTGSTAAGRSIHDVAASRPIPIPVYAEMGSLNPLFIGPGALAVRSAAIADGLAGSITQGTGQFCTKPGVVVVADDESGRRFARTLAERVAARAPGVMLNAGLCTTLDGQIERTAALPGVTRLTESSTPEGLSRAGTVLATTADVFLGTPPLQEEHFGPLSIVVYCAPSRMRELAGRLPGNLTATVHADAGDSSWAADLAETLAAGAGRLIFNGYPTGVAVTPAMHHGGPYPASTSAAHTSVGATAIRRFLRPVAWQNAPDALLPAELRDGNPLRLQRLIDGRWETA